MESSLHSKKKIPNYVLVSIALVQSEIFWFYSVLYYIFRESGLVNEQAVTTTTTRSRSHSAPPTSKPFTKKDFVTLDDTIVEEEEEENHLQRRYSLPNEGTVNIRDRPSVEDELVGTTCPPVIWQKLRVKLGRPPVHGDPKPKSIHSVSPSPSPSPPVLKSFPSSSSGLSIKRIDSTSPSVSTRSATESLYSLPEESSSSLSLSKSSTTSSINEETCSISPSTQQKKLTKKKIISKLNSAFHLHRSRSSTDLSKTNTL